jgi:ABC-2 type transport system permease protein
VSHSGVLRVPWARARRGSQVAGAFVWMGYTEAVAYPLFLAIQFVSATTSPIVYHFVSRLVDSGPSVGDNYYTFAIIGLSTALALDGGLRGFGNHLDYAVQQGTLETLLIEPIRWRLIPFGLAGWPVLVSVVASVIAMSTGLALGADIRLVGVPGALLVLALGIAAGHSIGVVAASVKILSKRSDPVLSLYTLASSVLAGVVFPVALLPLPLRILSYCIPQTYVLSAMRRLLMADSSAISGPSTGQSILMLVTFIAVVYPLGLWLYGRSLEYGRKLGVLAGY